MANKLIDMVGKRFGKLLVVKKLDKRKGRHWWLCQCDCGNLHEIKGDVFRHKVPPKSCGCLPKHRTHGHSRTPNYYRWNSMLERTENPNNNRYSDWGGRGIKVCERWHKYENFLEDMGLPLSGMVLDRIDNNGSYCLENCRWVSYTESNRNRRPRGFKKKSPNYG